MMKYKLLDLVPMRIRNKPIRMEDTLERNKGIYMKKI